MIRALPLTLSVGLTKYVCAQASNELIMIMADQILREIALTIQNSFL